MWIRLSQANPAPIYQQIVDQVRAQVAGGAIKPGDAIPSIRQLAAELAVSVISVQRAYLELERDGVIVTRQGVGSFIALANQERERTRLRRRAGSLLADAAEAARQAGMKHREFLDEAARAFSERPPEGKHTAGGS